jgi:uncharacterized protein (DUF433 family)
MTTTTVLPQAAPAEQPTEHPHVIRTDGAAMVRGTRIAVRLIAQMYRAGDSVDDILRTYPHLNAAAVHDAISYYLDHRAEIEQEISANRIEIVLAETGAKMDERGFITFPATQTNG